MTWVMQRDPVIATQISDNLLVRLQSFASDLRRLDNYLAQIEEYRARDYSIRALPEAQGHRPRPLCLVHRRSRCSGCS